MTLNSRFSNGMNLITQLQRKRLRLFAPDENDYLLDTWQDLARAESIARTEYHDRYLFELLQNAHDAVADSATNSTDAGILSSPGSVRFDVTKHSLLVSNSGTPFSEENVTALCRLYFSTKVAGNRIGYKGIGFKSVLQITDAPEVYSGNYAFGFDQTQLLEEVQKRTGQSVNRNALPTLHVPFHRSVTNLPTEDYRRVEELLSNEYVTVIRLPFKSSSIAEKVECHIRSEVTPRSLLFLPSVDHLSFVTRDGRQTTYEKQLRSAGNELYHYVALVERNDASEAEPTSWLVLEPKTLPITDPSLTEDLDETWQSVAAVNISAAFPLTAEGELDTELDAQPFYVYFPTAEPSGLRFLVNADFYIQTARKDITAHDINKWLVEELAQYIASNGVEALKQHSPSDSALVDMLAPATKPDRELGAHFRASYIRVLSSTAFVPVGAHYVTAPSVRFTPDKADYEFFHDVFAYSTSQTLWPLPSPELEERERTRAGRGVPFLLDEDIGVTPIKLNEVVRVLEEDGAPPSAYSDPHGFLWLLADWADGLIYWDRKYFIAGLANCRIVPTSSGWYSPAETEIFQPNFGGREKMEPPEGFHVEIVSKTAYGEEFSEDSQVANFLRDLGVNSYRRDRIIEHILLPILSDAQHIQELFTNKPEAIAGAYQFLKSYFSDQNKAPSRIGDLFVPAYVCGQPDHLTWRPAREVYFSTHWTGHEALERIYGCCDDVWFLAPLSTLVDDAEAEDIGAWLRFFAWVGIADQPRILAVDEHFLFEEARWSHPFSVKKYWANYLERHENTFLCTNSQKNHGYSRRMAGNWALDHFEDLVELADEGVMTGLFQLLGADWGYYSRFLETTLNCKYVTTRCDGATIPSYFAYCLTNVRWLPAALSGQPSDTLWLACDIWNLGEDVPHRVRRALPALPDQFLGQEYQQIRSDLLRTEYRLEDYLYLLERFHTLFPLEVTTTEDNQDRRQQQQAIRSVFYWLCGAMENALKSRGDRDRPTLPDELKILAFDQAEPCYVDPRKEWVFYADDRKIAEYWKDELTWFAGDSGWSKLREWLEIESLSQHVESKLLPYDVIDGMATSITARFQQTQPFFLALVLTENPSRYEQCLNRLLQLRVEIVAGLTVQHELPKPELPAKEYPQDAYLLQEGLSDNGQPAIPDSATLLVALGSADNPYILGQHVVKYLGLPSMRDAYDALYSLENDRRLEYLASRGVVEDAVRQVLGDVERWTVRDAVDDSSIIVPSPVSPVSIRDDHDAADTSTPTAATTGEEDYGAAILEPDQIFNSGSPATSVEPDPVDAPDKLHAEVYEPTNDAETARGAGGSPRQGSPGGGTPVGGAEAADIGKRGERLAYQWERNRLEELGLDPDEMEQEGLLQWVAAKFPQADHDIRSVDYVGGNLVPIFIEVKATKQSRMAAHWSGHEYRLAQNMGDRYRIYWLTDVYGQVPRLVISQDPVGMIRNKQLVVDLVDLVIQLPDDRGSQDTA